MLNMGKTNGELHALLIEYENSTHGLGGEWKLKQGAVYLHVSRQGASYFITFTDDFSRYGYVYLLKHKHEVFETFKDYALESATRILNMVPTKKALVKRVTPEKLQQRSIKCIFVGYPKETMGYYFYFPPKNKIVVARYAEFFEKNLISQEASGRAVELEEIQEEDI
ncbi:hypothetical protein Tco_0970767 [Tanacetum coccineum]